MIIWAKANQEDFKVTVDKAYRLLKALKDYGSEFSPNYLPAYHKKDAKQYDLSYETLEILIQKGRNKEGNRVFPDLGYHVSFFSALNDDDSAGISLTIGMSNPKFINSFVVHFPISLNIFDDNATEKLIYLFKKSILIFDPFWGCISSSLNQQRLGPFYENDKPKRVHWVNFWDMNTIRSITEEKIKKAPLYSIEKIDAKGYILILEKKPFDDNDEADVKLQNEVDKILGLN